MVNNVLDKTGAHVLGRNEDMQHVESGSKRCDSRLYVHPMVAFAHLATPFSSSAPEVRTPV